MNKSLILAVTLTAAATATTVQAKNSSTAEFRGFQTCVKAVDEQSNGLATKRTYLLNKENEKTNYFINGSRWEGSERTLVRISCATDRRGAKLLNASVEPGQWVQDRGARVRVELAQN
ncbi:MAG: hypothetical protein GKR90_00720 [Pseudomonadales bacterium]|nr:hypothetical protein [Pseudomonadales bacterium]